jgi:S-DNA-T family DNA segregation ATPase FtsK/SpoIIIE
LIIVGKFLHDVFVGLFKGIAKGFVIIGESIGKFFANFRESMDEHKKEIRAEEKERKKEEKQETKKLKAKEKEKNKKEAQRKKGKDKVEEVDEEVRKGAEELKQKEADAAPKADKKERRTAVTVSSLEVNAMDRKPIQTVKGDYALPSTELLKGGVLKSDKNVDYTEDAEHLTKTLASFGIKGEVVHIVDGPALARFDVELAIGTKVARVQGLANDIALAMKVEQVRIAPVAGNSLLGIEVPKSNKQSIFLKELIEDEQFQNAESLLSMAIGRDLGGAPIIANLKAMPHLLIAGSTGSGKSVCINTIIMSILYNASPDEVKLILVDPKRVELTHYRDLAHLIAPVITDVKKAAYVLKKLTYEMDYRYDMLSKEGAREIDAYNVMVAEYNEAMLKESDGEEIPEEDMKKSLPYIVLVIDELADLMTQSKATVEGSLQRLAQLARAVGIHIILATQRPSVDVITGVIKANFPSRIAFQVMSHVDSRTIIDSKGAEALLGKGDMLYAPSEQSKPTRGQAAFVSTAEISKVVHFIKKQRKQVFSEEFDVKDDDPFLTGEKSDDGKGGAESPLLKKAQDLARAKGNISTSYLQRKLGIGYSKAARLIDDMEEKGIISESDGNKPREYIGE